MRSLLLGVIAAFGFSVLMTGCGEGSSSAPAKAPGDPEGGPPKTDPEKKRGRLPKREK
jgi:hypothetical protein